MSNTTNNQDDLFDLERYKEKLSDNLLGFITQLQTIAEVKNDEIVSTIKGLGDVALFIANYKKAHQALRLSKGNLESNLPTRLQMLEEMKDVEESALTTDHKLFISNFKLEVTTCLFRMIVLIEALEAQVSNTSENEHVYIYQQIQKMSLGDLFPIDTFENRDENSNDQFYECTKNDNEWTCKLVTDKDEDFDSSSPTEKEIQINGLPDSFYFIFKKNGDRNEDGSKFAEVELDEAQEKEIATQLCEFLNGLASLSSTPAEEDIKKLTDILSTYNYQYMVGEFENALYLKKHFSDMTDYFIFNHKMKEMSFFGTNHQWLWRYSEGRQDLFRNVGTNEYFVPALKAQDRYKNMIRLAVNHMNSASIASYSKNAYRCIYKYLQIRVLDRESTPNPISICKLEYNNNDNSFIQKADCSLNIRQGVSGKFALVKQAPTNVMRELNEIGSDGGCDFSLNNTDYKCPSSEHINFYESITEDVVGLEGVYGFTLDIFENKIPSSDIKIKDVRHLFKLYQQQFRGSGATGFSMTKVAPADKEVVMLGNMCDGIIPYDGVSDLHYDDCKENFQYEVELDFLDCLCLLYHINQIKIGNICIPELKNSFLKSLSTYNYDITEVVSEAVASKKKEIQAIVDAEIKKERAEELCSIEEEVKEEEEEVKEINCTFSFEDMEFVELNICPPSVRDVANMKVEIQCKNNIEKNILRDIKETYKSAYDLYTTNYNNETHIQLLSENITTQIRKQLANDCCEMFEALCKEIYENTMGSDTSTKRKIDFIMSFIEQNSSMNDIRERGEYRYSNANNPIDLLKRIFL